MVAAVAFQAFIERLAEGEINWQSDTFKVALSNTAPNASTDNDLSDITEISAGNGYTAGGPTVTVSSSSQSAGTFNAVISDLDPAITATGTIGPFRYLILYDDTHASDALVCYWDYGSAVTMNDGDTFSFNFGAATFTLAPA